MLAANTEPAIPTGDGPACNTPFAWRRLAGKPIPKRFKLVASGKGTIKKLLKERGLGTAFALSVNGQYMRRAVCKPSEHSVVPTLIGARAAPHPFVIGGEVHRDLRLLERATKAGHMRKERDCRPAGIATPCECL
jgi:hypothetical protein